MKGVIGKEVATVLIILLSSIPLAFSLVPEPPHIFLGAYPESQDIQAGGSATLEVIVIAAGEWKSGDVALALVNPPPGVTATFSPEKMNDVQIEGFTSNVAVKVAADAPQGKATITVRGTGLGYPNSGGSPSNLNASTTIILNIVPSTGKTTTTTTNTNSTKPLTTAGLTATVTSVVTSTVTATTVSTMTVISTERSQPQPSELKLETNRYLTFGIGALVVSSVLFISGVLLLASNRKHHYN